MARMTLAAQTLAQGNGWQISEVVCRAGPDDVPFEEQHQGISIAVVLDGTFGYRTSPGRAVLSPGAVLLGNEGDCFECGHRHSIGDRCLSVQFTPDYYERIAADVVGVTRLRFGRATLPPHGAGQDLLPIADAVRDQRGMEEEFACDLAARVAAALQERQPLVRTSPAASRRVEEIVHWIEEQAHEPQSQAAMASMACMSPYHFLRGFRDIVGLTPHQFVLSLRLRRAARQLRREEGTITAIALEAGFADLYEFNRRFRRVLGDTPSAYRKRLARRPARAVEI